MAFIYHEVVYYIVLWSLSFIAGISRAFRDHDYQHPWDAITIGIVGGFYGFATVAVLSHYGPSVSTFGWGYLGIAICVGTLGKEQDKVMRWVLTKILSKLIGSESDNQK